MTDHGQSLLVIAAVLLAELSHLTSVLVIKITIWYVSILSLEKAQKAEKFKLNLRQSLQRSLL